MRRIVVLAIGSRIMKDDGIAPRVIEHIEENLIQLGVEVVIGETDFEFCINKIKQDDFLIITDAMFSDDIPGSIKVLPINEALVNQRRLYSQHEMNLFDWLASMFINIEGYMIGIEVSEICFGLELSSDLQERFEPICKEVEAIISRIVGGIRYA